MAAVRGGRWSRASAALVMCLVTGVVVVTHQDDAGSAAGAPDPHAVHIMPRAVPVAVTTPAPLPRTGWTVTADSATGGAAANVLDGNPATTWRTAATALPHTLTIDTHNAVALSGLTYLPPSDSANGRIGQYRIQLSNDGTTWGAPVATGTFADDGVLKTVTVATVVTRFVRLTALTEAGARGTWSAAAEINLLGGTDPVLPRTGWTVAADSQEATGESGLATHVLDGDTATIWHTRYNPAPPAPLPHTLTLDLKTAVPVGGLTYLPRSDASPNGRIGRYKIETSANGTSWSARLTNGSFQDTAALQTVVFPPATARYVRLTAQSEAGTRGPWSSAAEINLLGPSGSVVAKRGTWSAPVGFPLVPVAAAQLPNGKILTWSAFMVDQFGNGSGRTVTATYDPTTGVVTQRTVTETGHDMFCPGISVLPDGRIVVTGGNDSGKTSIYNPANDSWTTGPAMRTPRGYQASTTLSDGRVFTIGGSWSGGVGGNGVPRKSGEVFSPSTGWTALPGADVAPMLTADTNPNGDYRKDNHAWLFAWTGGRVFQAGPSRAMNWYTTTGAGGVTPAGNRADDAAAMNGNAVMYDAGKILTVGGAPDYENDNATSNAYVITLNGTTASTRRVAPMANTRAFHNSVVLPDGKVVVFGGQNYPVPFSDNTSVLTAELWDPATESFTTMAPAAIPRTYHSVALLMPDGRVFTGGGGLCGTGCATNHFDGEIFTPPNLLNANGSAASRPTITTAPTTATTGATITVATNRAVTGFALVRMGTTTHSVNTDQRRIALTPTAVSGGYRLTVPADKGVALPGYWMLFALDANGVPSVAKTIRIS